MVFFLTVFTVDLILAAIGFYVMYKLVKPRNIDYKDRWVSAVELLGIEGRLTDEEIRSISLMPAQVVAAETKSLKKGETSKPMRSWDRRDIEVARAKSGLPPEDDLEGMRSWDRKDVLTARAKYFGRRRY